MIAHALKVKMPDFYPVVPLGDVNLPTQLSWLSGKKGAEFATLSSLAKMSVWQFTESAVVYFWRNCYQLLGSQC